MTGLRRGATAREFLVAIVVIAAVGGLLYFSGGIQVAYTTVADLFKAGKETASNISDVIESEKSPRAAASVQGGLDTFRIVLTLQKAPGELQRVRASVTANSPDGSKFVQNVEWENWKPGEEKTVPVNAMTIKSIVVEGSATHDGKEIKIWPDVNKTEWEPPYQMPVLDHTRFDLRRAGANPSKEFRIRSLQRFELKRLDLAIKTISKSGELREAKVPPREVWRTDEEISFELPDPNYRKLTLEGTAQAQGKTVRVAVSWVQQDDK
jgi:hypothetical protein